MAETVRTINDGVVAEGAEPMGGGNPAASTPAGDARGEASSKSDAAVDAEARPIKIQVNHLPVIMPKHEATGLKIKEAAIAQGVAIELDFVLSRRVGPKHEVIGDADVAHLLEGEEFSAVAPDDNS